MTNQSAPAKPGKKPERSSTPYLIGIFGAAMTILMVVMIGSIKDLRTDLTVLDSSLIVLQEEMVANRVAVVSEVAGIDDDITSSIGELRTDIAVTNQQLLGIDLHLSALRQEMTPPATDFSRDAETVAPVNNRGNHDK
ncbi:MAG: hypothetical protein AAF563_20065 [Pseudomonadota bacterium]